jgi:hypothetical protein
MPTARRICRLAALGYETIAVAAGEATIQAREQTEGKGPGPAGRDSGAEEESRQGAGNGRPGGRRAEVWGKRAAAEDGGGSHDGLDCGERVA